MRKGCVYTPSLPHRACSCHSPVTCHAAKSTFFIRVAVHCATVRCATCASDVLCKHPAAELSCISTAMGASCSGRQPGVSACYKCAHMQSVPPQRMCSLAPVQYYPLVDAKSQAILQSRLLQGQQRCLLQQQDPPAPGSGCQALEGTCNNNTTATQLSCTGMSCLLHAYYAFYDGLQRLRESQHKTTTAPLPPALCSVTGMHARHVARSHTNQTAVHAWW